MDDTLEPRLTRFEGFEGIHLVADVRGRRRRLARAPHARRRPDPSRLGQHRGRARSKRAGRPSRSTSAATATANGPSTATTRSPPTPPTAWRSSDQLGRPPVLVGASLGGVAAMIAEGATDRVVSSGLVIVDITHRSNPEGIERIRDFMSSGLGGFATLEDAADAIAAYTPEPPKRVNPAGPDEGAAPAARRPVVLALGPEVHRPGPRPRSPGRTSRGCSRPRCATSASRRCSCAACSATWSPRKACRTSSTTSPASKLVDVGGAAHMVAGDQNDAFSTAVVDFLEHDVRPTLP